MKVMLHWLEDLDSSYFEEAELSNVRVRGCDRGGNENRQNDAIGGEHLVTVVPPFRHRYFIVQAIFLHILYLWKGRLNIA